MIFDIKGLKETENSRIYVGVSKFIVRILVVGFKLTVTATVLLGRCLGLLFVWEWMMQNDDCESPS